MEQERTDAADFRARGDQTVRNSNGSAADVVPLLADGAYRLHLTGLDDQAPDAGELHHGEAVVAIVQRSAGGEWFARMAAEGLPADVTPLVNDPQTAAEQGAVLFSGLTGLPYGEPPTAAGNEGPLSRPDAVRAELQDTAERHREAVTYAAARVWPTDYLSQPSYGDLIASLGDMSKAWSNMHPSWQMAGHMTAVEQMATGWRDALPADGDNFERQLLAYPLAHLVHDVRRLQTRLQLTVEAVKAERDAVARQQATTEAAPSSPAPAPEPEQEPSPADMEAADPNRQEPSTAEAQDGSALAASTEQLPLWTVPAASGDEAAATETADGPVDVVAAFRGVQEAWAEIVPEERGTAAELFDDVRIPLADLQRWLADEPPAPTPAVFREPASAADVANASTAEEEPWFVVWQKPRNRTLEEPVGQQPDLPGSQQQAATVNAALRQTDTRSAVLQGLPEWQQIQTVRGAFAQLGRVLRERAGEFAERLMGDRRVGDFFRKLSVSACEKIAEWAQKGADKFRGSERGQRDLPSAESLLQLGGAAFAYSSSHRRPGDGTPPSSSGPAGHEVNVPELRKMGEALNRPMPTASGSKAVPGQSGSRVSAAAARGRSTTVKRSPTLPSDGGQQAGHLRRGGSEQQGHKPTQR